MKRLKTVSLSPAGATVNGAPAETLRETGLNAIYRKICGDYPKFFKMDGMCKTGFIAAEILLQGLDPSLKESMGCILFSHAGCLATDRRYQETIADPDAYFPSPALFVYTLANIVTGEIAIRHGMRDESSMYLLDSPDPELEKAMALAALASSDMPMLLAGWVDYENDNCYNATLNLYTNE